MHPTGFCYTGDADPSAPGGIAAIYRDLAADDNAHQPGRRRRRRGPRPRAALPGADPVDRHLEPARTALCATTDTIRWSCAAAWAPKPAPPPSPGSSPTPAGPPLLVVATGSYIGEGFDCPALDTLFLAAPIAFKGRLVQYAGRILRPHPGKTTAEIHDYHDVATGVLAASLAKRAPGYTSLGFPDPRRLPHTPSSRAAREITDPLA